MTITSTTTQTLTSVQNDDLTSIKQRVSAIIQGIMPQVSQEQLNQDLDLFSLGINSISAIRLITQLQSSFGISFTKTEINLDNFRTLSKITGLLERKIVVIDPPNQAPTLSPLPERNNLPLSLSQERIWLAYQLNPQNTAHNLCLGFRLTGSLHLPALEQSLTTLITRHETLRTTFTSLDDKAVQVIASPSPFSLDVVNIQESQTSTFIENFTQTPFDLTQEFPFRAQLLQQGETDSILLMCLHQMVFDGWSEGVLLRELRELYRAFSTQQPVLLPELPIQYGDFCEWQRQCLETQESEQLAYWQEQLKDCHLTPQSLLPTDYPRSNQPNPASRVEKLVLSESLTTALHTLSKQKKITLFTTLLTSFQLLLHCYSEQQDILVCSPTAQRNKTELEGLIGYFVNLLILRTNFSENPNILELLDRVSPMFTGAYSHQDIPVQQMLEKLELNHLPLSQVMFTFQNMPRETLTLEGLEVTPLGFKEGVADFDLALSMVEQDGQLQGTFKYNRELFAQSSIAQMVQDFETVLGMMVSEKEQTIAQVRERINAPMELHPDALATSTPDFVAPRNPLEIQLQRIWQQVLGIEKIGVEDNFFRLGGKSLLALRLLTEIQKTFNTKLSLANIFQSPTIAQLANLLDSDNKSGSKSSLVVIQEGGKKPPLFVIGVLGEGLSHCNLLAKYLSPDQPIYGLSVGIMDEDAWKLVTDVADQYLQDLRQVQPKGPYLLAGPFCGGRFAYTMAQRLQDQGEEVALVALLDTMRNPFNSLRPFQERLIAHWQLFLKYGSVYFVNKGTQQLNKLQEKFMGIGYKLYQKLGLPLPQFLKDFAYREELSQDREALREKKRQARVGKKIQMTQAQQQKQRQTFSFAPKELYKGQVLLFRPIDDIGFFEPDLGWNELSPGGLEYHDVPGDFNTFFQEPNVQKLAQELSLCIDRALAEGADTNSD